MFWIGVHIDTGANRVRQTTHPSPEMGVVFQPGAPTLAGSHLVFEESVHVQRSTHFCLESASSFHIGKSTDQTNMVFACLRTSHTDLAVGQNPGTLVDRPPNMNRLLHVQDVTMV